MSARRCGGRPRGATIALVLSFAAAALQAAEAAPVLALRAAVANVSSGGGLTITLVRWSTDAERAPIVSALAAPAPAQAATEPAAAGRGGRGGARAGGTPPPSPTARLSAAIKAAPTLGYIWSDGVTGYSIKYAWHAPSGPAERVVLITERRLGAHAPDWGLAPSPGADADAEFTLIEMRLDPAGKGEGKTSLTTSVVVDPAFRTLALDGYAAAPALLRITR